MRRSVIALSILSTFVAAPAFARQEEPGTTTPPEKAHEPGVENAPKVTATPTSTPEEAPAPREPAAVKPEAGYFPGQGFVLRSSDENFRLRIGLQSALRAQVTINGMAKIGSPFMTLRPIIEGSIYKKWIRYWTSLELAANPVYLLDSYVEIQPVDALGIRVGQQWTPFSRHEAITGPTQLLMPDWSPVSDYFWTGRDKGVTLFGTLGDKKFDYALGAYLGTPLRQFTTIRGNYMFIARVSLSPEGAVGTEYAYADDPDKPAPFRWALALNGATSKVTTATENFNPSTFKFDVVPTDQTNINTIGGADFFLQSSRFVALTEGYVRRTNPGAPGADYTSIGAFAQAGVLVYKRAVDVAARFEWVDVNLDADHDTAFGIEAATSWYVHSPNVAIKLRYGFGSQMTPPDGNTAASRAAPLILAPGHLHVMTAQLNTTF